MFIVDDVHAYLGTGLEALHSFSPSFHHFSNYANSFALFIQARGGGNW
jgi:hypothetical protein